MANVTVAGGVASTAIPVDPAWFNGQTRYLGVSVGGGSELLPRVLVTAVPYAIHSLTAAGASGVAIEAGNPPSGALRGLGGTWLFGYSGSPEAEEISIGARDGGSQRTLTLAAGGRPRVHIAENGFVGVGALRPDSLLHLHGPDVELRLTNPQESPSGALRGNAGTWLFGYAGVPGREDISIGALDAASERTVTIIAGGDRRIRVEAGGNVGIGTLNPMAKLDVNGTTRTTVLQITSARAAKEGFAPVDAAAVLAKVAALPIATWAYTNSRDVRHLGPVAEDFHAAFALGDSAQHIATVDADGVALAAIQGLNEKLEEQVRAKDAKIDLLEKRLAELERLVTALVGRAGKEEKTTTNSHE